MYAYSQTGLTDLPRRYHVTSTEYCKVHHFVDQDDALAV